MEVMEHLTMMHNMCILELQNLMEGIFTYDRISTHILEKMSHIWSAIDDSTSESDLFAYDSFCSNISAVTNLARKFNLHLRLNKLLPESPEERNSCYNKKENWENEAKYKQDEYEQNYSRRSILPIEESGISLHSDREIAYSKLVKEEKIDTIENGSVQKSAQELNYSKVVKEEKIDPNENCRLPEANQKMYYSNVVKKEEVKTNGHATGALDKRKNGIIESRVNGMRTPDMPYKLPKGLRKKDISSLKKNNVFTATVTHIQNLQQLRFFVCEIKPGKADDNTVKIAQLSKMKHLRQYSRPQLPAEGEIFGIVLDDVIVRAINIKDNVKKSKMELLLLDLGETLHLNDTHIMYYLSVEYQQIPAQAIPCLLHTETNDNRKQLQTLLKSWKYQTLKLRVAQNDGSTLYVKPLADVAKPTDSNGKELAVTNPFLEDLIELPNTSSKAAQKGQSEPTAAAASSASASNQLTPEQWEMLYDEELCTTNAMKAVMGYDPKDDQRICRFYNPKTKSCFKGSSCRQEHTLLLKDGWTKDAEVASTVIDARTPLIVYPVGTIINITPTFIGDLERFYCQLNDDKNEHEPIIFTDDDIPYTQKLESSPLIFDLVLCRYQDGFWYRAKIIETDDDGKMFKVFYVDYGNSEIVHLRNLAKCNYEIAQWPFQAVLCRLADVRDATANNMDKRKQALKTLRSSILNKQLEVKVVSHFEELIVRIIDEQHKDLPKKLLALGYLKPFKLKL